LVAGVEDIPEGARGEARKQIAVVEQRKFVKEEA
jgi:hypothetical protein